MNPLAELLAFITRKKRYKVTVGVDFDWSQNSLTHNIFRFFELIFWRRKGIRLESTSVISENGQLIQFSHTWEAAIATIETQIRSALSFKFKKFRIFIPVLSTPTGISIPTSPYLFAVAFDAVASAANAGVLLGSLTYSHTCTGSNLTLGLGDTVNSVPTPTVSSATYNAVGMTQINNVQNDANTNSYQHYLYAPSTGANNVVISSSLGANTIILGGSISFSGTDSSPIGANNTAGPTNSTTPSVSVTTTFANSMLFDTVRLNSDITTLTPTVTGSNQTSRYQRDEGFGGTSQIGSTKTTTSTGSYTCSWSMLASTPWSSLVSEVKELASGRNSLTTLGVS